MTWSSVTNNFLSLWLQNRDRKDAKQSKAAAQQPSAVESDGKSDSGSEIDANVTDGKAHVEFTEEEFIAPETNTIQFKVCKTNRKLSKLKKIVRFLLNFFKIFLTASIVNRQDFSTTSCSKGQHIEITWFGNSCQ